jgi:tripartite-type tricarboxylate transporter receptor subunit TctC
VPGSDQFCDAQASNQVAIMAMNFYSRAETGNLGGTMTRRPKALSRRQLIKAGGAVATGIAAPAILRVGAALAAYPDRPVRIVVANTPGGPSDIIARMMSAVLQEATGASFVVENKGGGGGNIGMGSVARSEPDGYTILLSTSAYSVNPGLYNTLPYDPFKDFAAVCELAVSPHVFAVKPDLAVNTMKEFVALAKANQDNFNVSTPPIGTTPHLQAEVLKLREDLPRMATVVFPGGGDALKALISGTVQLSSGVLAPAHPQIKGGNVKGLAVTGEKRWHDLPDIPTMLEAGFPDFVFETYTALMAPAKTPPEIVARLEKLALEQLAKPDLRARLTQAGFDVTARDGKGHMERVAKEVPMFRDIITKAGIQRL